MSFSNYYSYSVLAIFRSYTALAYSDAIIGYLIDETFSTKLITFPLYVVINISYFPGVVIYPTSNPVIDSDILVSNLKIG